MLRRISLYIHTHILCINKPHFDWGHEADYFGGMGWGRKTLRTWRKDSLEFLVVLTHTHTHSTRYSKRKARYINMSIMHWVRNWLIFCYGGENHFPSWAQLKPVGGVCLEQLCWAGFWGRVQSERWRMLGLISEVHYGLGRTRRSRRATYLLCGCCCCCF